jgi:hypothetical protein
VAKIMVVRVDFSRNGKDYKIGDHIADPAILAELAGSDHEAHGHMIELPDDHHSVAPFVAAPQPAPDAARKRPTPDTGSADTGSAATSPAQA